MSSARRDDAHSPHMAWIHSNFARFDRGQDLPCHQPRPPDEFHPIDRKTHKRVHHQNVDESGAVENRTSSKAEYAKNKCVEIDPEELKVFRLAAATTMQIKQFI